MNLGCGKDIKEGWINLDSVSLPGVNIVHNIENLPLPFSNNEFDEILCKDILEHVEYIPVLKDLHRILKPEGILKIQVPHFSSKNNFVDPTHKKLFSVSTFDFFVRGTKHYEHKAHYYFDFSFSKILSRSITFSGDIRNSKAFFLNPLVNKFVNKNKWRQELYEDTALARLFPAADIYIELMK